MPRFVDANCSSCHGSGSAFLGERIDANGYWCSFGDCRCVEYKFTPEEKSRIAVVLVLAQALGQEPEKTK